MANTCGRITADLISFSCDKLPASGTGTTVYAVNYDEIDKTSSVVTGNVMTNLVLNTGKYGYKITANDRSTLGESTFNKGTQIDSYGHAVTIKTFMKDQLTKDFVNSIKGARVVLVVENHEGGTNGDTKWEVYGYDSGMTLMENPFSTDYTDSIVYSLKIGSDDTSPEAQLPLSYFDTDLATTEAKLEALLAP